MLGCLPAAAVSFMHQGLNRRLTMRHLFAATALGLLAAGSTSCAGKSPAAQAVAPGQQLLDAVAASSRTSANVLRDRYRHPVETLSFFGVQPDHVVVEIWPAGGWYTEILAPYLKRGGGTYYGVGSERMVGGPKRLMSESPELYDQIRTADFPAAAGSNRVPDNSADVVLTFRNVHNWMMGENPFADEAFTQMYAMLKPGGILGVVDHRLPENRDAARERASGYLKVSTVRRLAEAAGFRFVGSSEVNANPKDTTDWPDGVWTLPPRNRGDEANRAKYLEIGESDRMTLKFQKPG
jgi:predicted methyltransferase